MLLIARGGVVLPLDPARRRAGHGAGDARPGQLPRRRRHAARRHAERHRHHRPARRRPARRIRRAARPHAAALPGRDRPRRRQPGRPARRPGAARSSPMPTAPPCRTPPSPMPAARRWGFAGRLAGGPGGGRRPGLLRDGTHAVAGQRRRAHRLHPQPARRAGRLHHPARPRARTSAWGPRPRPAMPWPPHRRPPGSARTARSPRPSRAPATHGGLCRQRHRRPRPATAPRRPPRRPRRPALTSALEARFGRQSGVDVDAEMAGMVDPAECLCRECQGARDRADDVGHPAGRDTADRAGGQGDGTDRHAGPADADAALLRGADAVADPAGDHRAAQPRRWATSRRSMPRALDLRAEIGRRDTYGSAIGQALARTTAVQQALRPAGDHRPRIRR